MDCVLASRRTRVSGRGCFLTLQVLGTVLWMNNESGGETDGTELSGRVLY
jgi:hypothetical protein